MFSHYIWSLHVRHLFCALLDEKWRHIFAQPSSDASHDIPRRSFQSNPCDAKQSTGRRARQDNAEAFQNVTHSRQRKFYWTTKLLFSQDSKRDTLATRSCAIGPIIDIKRSECRNEVLFTDSCSILVSFGSNASLNWEYWADDILWVIWITIQERR